MSENVDWTKISPKEFVDIVAGCIGCPIAGEQSCILGECPPRRALVSRLSSLEAELAIWRGAADKDDPAAAYPAVYYATQVMKHQARIRDLEVENEAMRSAITQYSPNVITSRTILDAARNAAKNS